MLSYFRLYISDHFLIVFRVYGVDPRRHSHIYRSHTHCHVGRIFSPSRVSRPVVESSLSRVYTSTRLRVNTARGIASNPIPLSLRVDSDTNVDKVPSKGAGKYPTGERNNEIVRSTVRAIVPCCQLPCEDHPRVQAR